MDRGCVVVIEGGGSERMGDVEREGVCDKVC